MSSADTIHARCLECGECFSAPADAAEHHAEHWAAWAVPLAWLREADVLTPEAFFEWAARVGKVST